MKKKLNVIIGILLIGCIGLSVFLFIKYRGSEKSYDELLERKNELALQYNSLLDEKKQLKADYESLTTSNEQLQADYESLQSDYDTLIADYTELELLYMEETEVTYETPADLSEYATDITYDNLARTPDDYEGKAVKLYGKVIQLIEGGEETQIRLAVDGDYDKIILIGYDPAIVSERVLEDDYITIYGISMGIYTYESTIGGMISVPAVYVEHIEMN